MGAVPGIVRMERGIPISATESTLASQWEGVTLHDRTMVVNMRDSDYDVYIGRGGPWGNPFIIGRDGSRKEVLALYEDWIARRPALHDRARRELRGKILGCYCKPLDCHGDTLARIANGPTGAKAQVRGG